MYVVRSSEEGETISLISINRSVFAMNMHLFSVR
jgi:hypothetical protein